MYGWNPRSIRATAARGDQVFATLERDVKDKGRTLIPKGARVHGRLLRLEHTNNRTMEFYTIGLEFSILEFGNVRARTAAAVGQVAGGLGDSILSPGKLFDRPAGVGTRGCPAAGARSAVCEGQPGDAAEGAPFEPADWNVAE